jgi:hypothetical protein
LIISKDTLVIIKGTLTSKYTYRDVCVRDPSVQLNDLVPIKTNVTKKTGIFRLNISSRNQTSIISFCLPQRQNVGIVIFDLAGRMVKKCLDQTLEAGQHQIQFNHKSSTNNSYICKINIAGSVLAKQFTVIK